MVSKNNSKISNLSEKVRGSLRGISNLDVKAIEGIADDQNLYESGILDSLSMIEFVSELEGSLGISFNVEDLVAERFTSIKSISKLVEENYLKS